MTQGALVIDRAARLVTRLGRPVRLTRREYGLLSFMAEHPGQAFSRNELLAAVWAEEASYLDAGTVAVHIRRLRLKLEDDPDLPTLLVTVHGRGYRVDLPGRPAPRPPTGAVPGGSFIELIEAQDHAGATAVATAALGRTGSLESVVDDLIVPAMRRIGDRWYDNGWSIAETQVAITGMKTVLASLGLASARPAVEGSVMVAVAEGDAHLLPATVLAAVLRSHGWSVTLVGGSVPAADLERFVARRRPDALLVSATTCLGIPGMHRAVRVGRTLGVPVVLGGSALRGRDDAATLGASAWAASPGEAAQLLRSRLRPPRRTPVSARRDHGQRLDLDTVRLGVLGAARTAAELHPLADPSLRRQVEEDAVAVGRATAAGLLLDDRAVLGDYLRRRRGSPPLYPGLGDVVAVVAESMVGVMVAEGHRAAARFLERAYHDRDGGGAGAGGPVPVGPADGILRRLGMAERGEPDPTVGRAEPGVAAPLA